jgi:hypothetical protein
MEFQRMGGYDFVCTKAKELGLEENCGIKNIDVKDSEGQMIVDRRQVLKIWENYITKVYNKPDRPENLEV